MSGASGKGTSQAKTTQTAYNQQTGVDSGIGLGAYSHGNTVQVQTSDPETVRNALLANAATAGSAFDFATKSGAIAADTNKFAISALENTAGMSVLASNDLATKFLGGVSDLAAKNVNLLQSVGQNQTEVALTAQRAAGSALDRAFSVSEMVAPQDPSYALQATIGKIGYIIAAIVVAGVVAVFVFRKKS